MASFAPFLSGAGSLAYMIRVHGPELTGFRRKTRSEDSIPCRLATLGVRSLRRTELWRRCASLTGLGEPNPPICNCCEGCNVPCDITALNQALAAARRYQATWESHVA